MTVRPASLLAAAVGLWLTNTPPRPAAAQDTPKEPARLDVASAPSANQRLADAVAAQLRQSGQLRHYQVNIVARNGVVELTGHVADAGQRDEAVRLVHAVPGVERVRDQLTVGEAGAVRRTALAQPILQEPGPLPGKGIGNVPPPPAGAGPPEPTPIFAAPPGLAYSALNPPPLPPYAWPTFAPYNNYSRVGYPTLLPYKAWPYIGPQYPFPKVPLGWRSVQLTYYDGVWWFGRRANGHDWWRIRYW